jgi:hypothetical protein
MFEKTNRRELGETLDALYQLPGQLLSLYRNGTKPEVGTHNLKPHNDRIKSYARSVVQKVVGSDL